MISRRKLITGAALLAAGGASAQIFPPDGHATPIRTSPFAPEIFQERRQKLMQSLKDGIAVIYGADEHGGGNVSAPFQQDENFAWLTGIVDEPGAILVLDPAERRFREFLFLSPRDPETERWHIERLPLGAEMSRRTGFDRVHRSITLDSVLTGLTSDHRALHFLGPLVGPSAPAPRELELYGKIQARVPGAHIVDDSALMQSLRQVKEPREIEQTRLAMKATMRGHLAAMRDVRPGWSEQRLKGLIESEFLAGGGEALAYDSIVGSGRNAASLHYRGGQAIIADGDLVLIDAAAAIGGYTTDVTRTFPANGKFTAEQRSVYETVLAAQSAVVAQLKPGAYFDDLNEIAREVIRRAGHIDDFYHGIGHWVGLNVHDVGDYKKPIPAGAIVTVEPGIYVQSANFGIRIEDDYLVTPSGNECLSDAVPRSADAIEAFMARSRAG